jgi:fumarate hydratase subunit alpha
VPPAATREDIIDFVVDAVRTAGSNPCPPMVLGVGIGGTFEQCALLAKTALCRNVSEKNSDADYIEAGGVDAAAHDFVGYKTLLML